MTPSEQEREARRKLEVIIADSAPFEPWVHDEERDALDQYRLAVRRAAFADALEKVLDIEWCYVDGTPVRYIQREQALAALRGTEGT